MANVLKVGDRVQAKSKSLGNLNGLILGIDTTGKCKKFRILWSDNVERIVGSRSIENRPLVAPSSQSPLVLRLIATPGNALDLQNGSGDDIGEDSDVESSVDLENVSER